MPRTLHALLQDRPPVITAAPTDSLQIILERMLEHDYSQLPVVEPQNDGRGRVVGLVSTTSITRAVLHTQTSVDKLRVEHALVAHPSTARPDDELLTALELTRRARAVLVLDEDEFLQGILTDYDFAEHLRQHSTDHLLTADVESAVRQLISRAYASQADEELTQVVIAAEQGFRKSLKKDARRVTLSCLTAHNIKGFPKKVFEDAFEEHFLSKYTGKFDKLTFNQYIEIFLSKVCWEHHHEVLALPKATMRHLLESARNYRNRIAHLGKELSEVERHQIRYLLRQLERLLDTQDLISSVDEDIPDAPPPTQEESAHTEGLQDYLEKLDPGQDKIRISFSIIDQYMPGGVPSFAHEHRSWWDNNPETSQAQEWLDAGWRVVTVNMTTQQVSLARNTDRDLNYIRIFRGLFKKLDENSAWTRSTPSPAGRSWQQIAYLPENERSTASLKLGFTRDSFRIEITIHSGDQARNKHIFDALHHNHVQIQAQLGSRKLSWEKREKRKYSRVALYYPRPVGTSDSSEALEALGQWVAANTPDFFQVMRAHYPTEDALLVEE